MSKRSRNIRTARTAKGNNRWPQKTKASDRGPGGRGFEEGAKREYSSRHESPFLAGRFQL